MKSTQLRQLIREAVKSVLLENTTNKLSEKDQIAAVQKDGLSIQYIKNPTERAQLAAVKKIPTSIQYIQNPTQRVKQLAKSK